MTVDLSRLDAELESLSADQVAVARGMLAAREWAGQPLSEVDAALSSLANGVSVPPPTGEALADLFEGEALDLGGEPFSESPEPASARSISSDLAAALEDDDDLEASLGLSSGPSNAALVDDEDDLLEIDELEIVEDDELLVDD